VRGDSFNRLQRCYERDEDVIDAFFDLTDAISTVRWRERLLAAVMADTTSPSNLNPRRRHRSYPRVIRRARHNSYRVKRPGDTRHPLPRAAHNQAGQPPLALARSMINFG
jgi:hypothetical protein